MQIVEQITHQQQPCGTSCVSTCVAMLLDVHVDIIKDEFHKDYMKGKNIDVYLLEKGIIAEPLLSTYREHEPERVYLVTVPSLNMEGYTHQVIFDYRNGFQVFDPNMGKPGKKYYVWKVGEDLIKNEVIVHSWIFDFII